MMVVPEPRRRENSVPSSVLNSVVLAILLVQVCYCDSANGKSYTYVVRVCRFSDVIMCCCLRVDAMHGAAVIL